MRKRTGVSGKAGSRIPHLNELHVCVSDDEARYDGQWWARELKDRFSFLPSVTAEVRFTRLGNGVYFFYHGPSASRTFIDDIHLTGPKGLWDAELEGRDTSEENYPGDSHARWEPGQTMTVERLEMERRLKGHEDEFEADRVRFQRSSRPSAKPWNGFKSPNKP